MKKCMAGLATAVAALALAQPAAAGSTTYAVIGDTPYGSAQVTNFPNDVADINADPAVTRVIHLGDIKNGSSLCTTDYFAQIRADFDVFQDPLVYTPGDNEWTDCHRANNGAFWPAGPVLNGDARPARLEEIRRVFFDQPGATLGGEQAVVAQPAYPENVRWTDGDVTFATLHVVGSNNDWAPWFGSTTRSSSQVDEVEGRTAADIDWLKDVFREARSSDAAAVVISWQADVWDPAFVDPGRGAANPDPTQFDHFTSTVRALANRSRAFRRPVLLLNGDSHVFTDDRPLSASAPALNESIYGIDEDVPNLRRVTVNGSNTPCHEYLRLRIDSDAAGVFSYDRVKYTNQGPGINTYPSGVSPFC
jgi:hypothetical protein